MDKKETIKRFFKEGMLISPSMFEKISEKNIDDVIKKAKQNKIKNIENLDFISKPEPKKDQPKEVQEININIQAVTKKKKLSPKDFIDFYNKKYESIKQILLKRMQAVSINNTKNSFNDVSVIGMIKEINPQGFILEDPTGEIMVVSKEAVLREDDVIGVNGYVREGKIINGSIVYPDIPLSREIRKIDATVIFTTKPIEKTSSEYTITRDSKQKPDTNTTVLKSSPSWIEMEKGSEKIIIIQCDFPNEIDPEEATTWLKKRYVPDGRKIASNENPFVLSTIPDILWINSKSKWTKIYKGVIIVSITEKNSARINLQNKQIEIINNN